MLIKQLLNKLARVELLVINSFFSFRIILLVSKPLSEKKGLIFSQNFLLSLSFFIFRLQKYSLFVFLSKSVQKILCLLQFSRFLLFQVFKQAFFKSRSCHYGFPESFRVILYMTVLEKFPFFFFLWRNFTRKKSIKYKQATFTQIFHAHKKHKKQLLLTHFIHLKNIKSNFYS